MRFFYTLLLVMAGILSLSAQYEKGGWYLDVGSGIGYGQNTDEFGSDFQARLMGGYFVRDRLLLGAELRRNSYDNQGVINGDGMSLFARYYLPILKNSRLSFFGEAALNLGVGDGVFTDLAFGVGAEYSLASGILLTANLNAGWGGRRGVIGDLRIGTNYIFGGEQQSAGTLDYSRQKGDFLLDANFGSLNSNGRFYLAGDLNLSGGYFLSENLLVTGEVGFYRASYDLGIPTAPRELELTSYTSAAGLRYHFNNGKRLQPYLAAGLRYDYSREQRTNWTGGQEGTGTFSNSSLRADLRAGMLYHLNQTIAVDFGVGYQPLLSGTRPAGANRLSGQLGLKLFIGK